MTDADLQASEAAVKSLCLCICSAGGSISPCVSVQTKRVVRGSVDKMPLTEGAFISRSLVALSDIQAGTPLLRVPIPFIMTPSLATRIILAHSPLNASSTSPISHHQHHVGLSLLESLSPLGLLCAALAIIRSCSRDHNHCPICSPHTPYTLTLGAEPAASLLAIDDSAFDCHVQPLLLNTPLAQSLPRARVDLRAHLDEIAKLIQIGADDVLWAFSHVASRAMAIPDCSESFGSASFSAVSSSNDPPSKSLLHPPHTGPPSKRARTLARSIAAMVPLADFCNHSFTRSLSHFEFANGGRDGSDCVSLVCDCDVKCGDEVQICYGSKTTAQLLCFYGFEMGIPLPCDELHVSLVLPPVLASTNETPITPATGAADCSGSFAADSCHEFLSKCSLCISDDNSVTCSLWSSPPSQRSDSTILAPNSASPVSTPSSASSRSSPLHQSLSPHRIILSQPCVDIPKAVVDRIRILHSNACEVTPGRIEGCKSEVDPNILPPEALTEGTDWLQDLREMVAYEQTQAKIAGSSSSHSLVTCSPPSDFRPVSWELYSFLKLHGDPAVLALRWFRSALEKLHGHLDTGMLVSAEDHHPAAAQAAAYRACMRSVVEQQLIFLQGSAL